MAPLRKSGPYFTHHFISYPEPFYITLVFLSFSARTSKTGTGRMVHWPFANLLIDLFFYLKFPQLPFLFMFLLYFHSFTHPL